MANINTSVPLVERNEATQGAEEEVHNLDEFKSKANDFAHFAVKRFGGLYKHHFLTFKHEHEKDSVTVVHFTDSFFELFGIGRVESENYSTTHENDLKSLVTFEKGKCSLITNTCTYPSPSKKERLLRIMENMGENIYDIRNNNCEHFVNYVLNGEYHAPETNRLRRTAFFVDLYFSNMKVLFLVAILIISFVCITLSSNIRESYVSLLMTMILSFQRHDDFNECSATLGRKVLLNTKKRIEIERTYLKDKYKLNIDNTSIFVDSHLVCDKAQHWGEDSLMKSSIYLFVIWSVLQTVFIINYSYRHLKRMSRICILQEKQYLYRKSFYIEIFGGYAPIFTSVGVTVLIQYCFNGPIVAYYVLICFTAFCTRIFVVVIIELIFRCCPGRHEKSCSVLLILILLFTCVIFIIFHYQFPYIYRPF